MPALNVRENVTLPALLAGREPDAAWVAQVIDRVGLGHRIGHRPAGDVRPCCRPWRGGHTSWEWGGVHPVMHGE
ncbi:hypothetical protein SAMN05421869_12582 [Nonomuraea jiangxiensis]|uniref:Uncharacterized protein n=1 Tax=Nonomuraea jiangxiensis TaxID=633440 RepID=A0A1G9JMD7_9ACTN|nr:hypothetical protein SAMN05421869_12582 [Nonomuraea jiangxiensis]